MRRLGPTIRDQTVHVGTVTATVHVGSATATGAGGDPPTTEQRLATLESAVVALRSELSELRQDMKERVSAVQGAADQLRTELANQREADRREDGRLEHRSQALGILAALLVLVGGATQIVAVTLCA